MSISRPGREGGGAQGGGGGVGVVTVILSGGEREAVMASGWSYFQWCGAKKKKSPLIAQKLTATTCVKAIS